MNPEYKNLTKIPYFRRVVLQNFPFIEEDFDALTDYGLLCKVVEYLNKVIEQQNLVNDNTDALYQAYTTLKNYVENYFTNLDVQEEINNKLDAMAQDGSLTNLIKAYVDPIYQEYENSINNTVSIQNSRIVSVENELASIASGSPLVASSVSGMTDTTRVYVNTSDGHWYYYNGTSWVDGGVYQGTSVSTTDPTIEDIYYKLNPLYNNFMRKTNIQQVLYPGTKGRMNNLGVPVSSTTYGYTSKYFYAKAGSYFETADPTNTGLRIAQFTSPNVNDFVDIQVNKKSWVITTDNWYRVDVEYVDNVTVADESILEYLTGYIFNETTINVIDNTSLVKALTNPTITDINILEDITVTQRINIKGNKNINGNNNKLIGNSSLTYLLYVENSNTIINNLEIHGALNDVIYVGINSNCYINNCDIHHSYENDGVGLHGNANCYIYNSKIHDNYDEGLSTHDTSYCECYNVEAYNNGYEIGTDTPSGISFGGLHFGGSRMGKAVGCYCHDNSANGIGFITIDNNFSNTSHSICKDNICNNNAETGIKFGGCYNMICGQNICVNNVNGIVFYQKDQHGNTGYVAKNSCFSNSSSQQVVWTNGNDGLTFE